MHSLKYLFISVALFAFTTSLLLADEASESTGDEQDEIEEVIVKPVLSNVSYSANVSSYELLSHATDVLNLFPSLAFDNSIGQIRSRGAEANHLGIQVDGYDIGDPVSEFNFATMSCVGIASIQFNPTPASGAIAGVLNLRSTIEPVRSLILGGGSAGNLMQFSLGLENHSLALSNRHWNGVDVRNDGDVDSLQHLVFHYHFRAHNQWESTIRYGQSIQEYDPGVANIEQSLVGITGTILNRIVVRASSSINRAVWEESFTANSYGSRTKLGVLIPLSDFFSIDTTKTYDVNKSFVRGQAVRKPINTSIVNFIYQQSISALSWVGSIRMTDSSQDSAIFSTNFHTFWNLPSFLLDDVDVRLFVEIDDKTVSFPSMIDRYGWGQAWLPNPQVKPELGSGIDIGFKLSAPAGHVQLTRFHHRLRDKISFGRNVSENVDYGRNRGVEILWNWGWTTRLSSQLSYSYLDSETRQSKVHAYVRTQRRPSNILTGVVDFTTNYSQTVVQSRWVDKSIDACWRGCETLDPHLLVNFTYMRQIGQRVSASAQVYNVFDESYALVYGYNTPGRMFTLSLQLNFE
ncbi:MAG: TonB-dependent receptor [Gammaproteobacteria bacterium]|nr:TonB-dependent receptor [Gammaproteobacteria bacterium]